jgi:Glyoxalase/Bleomycin resistance protein/Dioxygenase superfamily
MKITPVLIVQQIEKSLPFWTDRLGFQKSLEVPDGEKLGCVLLVRNGAELMLQSVESVLKDEPKFAPAANQTPASLFIEVDDFEDILKRLESYPPSPCRIEPRFTECAKSVSSSRAAISSCSHPA